MIARLRGRRNFYIYILASRIGDTRYVGVTSDLIKRVFKYKSKAVDGFTARCDVCRLVYFEQFDDAYSAIQPEKRLKTWNRAWKIQLIEENNPNWIDLYPTVAGTPSTGCPLPRA